MKFSIILISIGDTKSLGVGTFSVAQKNAILEELEIERKNRPELEPLFSENKDERFFVKNLETIQGDERDVILISVGYGHDQAGKMSLNFGPLNQDGGERRLNVLITRAREKCVVFSNFKAYDMHLTANPPYGVKALKEFLSYAENLTLGASQITQQSSEPFEDAIASFLAENGYTVDKQIGCAGFRVDLAIVDDENPGKYILGITTDGKMYASSKVARDRDRLREQVLKGLGWKLYHLWSTDWYRNRDLGRKRLLEAVEIAIKETREEEKRKSEEAKKLAEKRKKEAEKLAEELRLAKQKELEEQKENEKSTSDIGEDENIEVIPPEEDLEFNENKNDSSDVEDDDYLFEGNSTESESGEDEVSDVEVILPEEDDDSEFEESVVSDVGVVSSEEDDDSEFEESVVSDVGVVSSGEDDDSLKSKKEDFSEVKEESSQESINDETKDIKDKNKSKKSLSKGFGISSIFKSKKKNAGKNTEKINDIKFSKNIENEDELDLKNDKIDSKPEEKAENVKVNAKNSDNDKEEELKASEPKEDINRDNDDIDSKEDELKSKEEVNESFDEEVNPIKSDNKKSKNNSIKSIFFDNERLENKEHGTIASAIIGKSKLEKEEIETVGGEIMENENPKLHRPTPKDEYVVEPEIIDENSQDGEKLYENLKFKSNVDLDDEDIHNVASDIVANAFEEVISDINNEKDIEVNIIDKDNYQDYDDENQYTQQDDNISQETSTTSTSVNQDDYYQGVSGITNPLKKNNIYHKTNDNKNKSVKDSLVDLKNEVKYINKSLKEIENPTPAEYVAVIDRTEEYNPDDYITPEHDEDEYVFSNDETEELTFAEAEEKRYEQEKLMEALKKEIASDENVIIPIHRREKKTANARSSFGRYYSNS